jgi:tRNA (guanosine-2'-O-)-methyltransferase
MNLKNKLGTPLSAERNEKVSCVLAKRQAKITIVIENVGDPHNIAAVMRTCDAVGINEIYVLNTQSHKYNYFDEQTSASANKWVKVNQFQDVDECFKHLRARYKNIYSTHLSKNALNLYELNLTESIAFVFGNERKGITPQSLAYCDANFVIPQVGMISSLNISVACAITLYEAYRQKKIAGHYDTYQLNDAQEMEVLESWGLMKV